MTRSTGPAGSLRAGRIGVLGGTFDPIHLGHVAVAAAAERALALDRVMLVPSRLPPHRPESAHVSAEHRLAMTALTAAEHPNWSASDLELAREGPSYTFDTLAELKKTLRGEAAMSEGRGEAATRVEWQFFFVIGADAFAEIATWSRYPSVLDLAHFAVVARPGITLDSLQKRLPDLAERMTTPGSFESEGLKSEPSARPRVILIEAATPDVSSTEIRRRVRGGESILGLVPGPVGVYISEHELYGGPGR